VAAFQVRTFKDIYDSVLEELKVQSSDTTSLNRVKRIINSIYLNEVCAYQDWKWLRESVDLSHDAKFNTGTASVTQNSKTVTLTTAPGTSQRGNWFTIEGYGERYRIAQHTANSTTVILESEFTGATNASTSFDIWTDYVALPSNCRETFEVTHDFSNEPLTGIGLQEYRRYVLTSPKVESRPKYYTTGDWIDPEPFTTISGLSATATRSSNGRVRTIVFSSDVSSLIAAGMRIEVTGASEEAYNGEFIVSEVSTTTIKYSASTSLSEASTADTGITTKKLSAINKDERQRELLLFPSKFDKKLTLHVDYIIDPRPLENDSDEPLIPIEHRAVLVYGTLMQAWRSIGRNPEEAATNGQLYDRKLSKMQGS
jgi:hypothetical protein